MNACVDIPVGTVPSLREFTRHVWRYRDASGQTVLVAPPGNIFTLVLDDENEANVSVTIAGLLVSSLGFVDRISVVFGHNVLIEFRDLQALYTFLQVLSMHADQSPGREVAAYCLSLLGFRWTPGRI